MWASYRLSRRADEEQNGQTMYNPLKIRQVGDGANNCPPLAAPISGAGPTLAFISHFEDLGEE